MKIFYHHPAFIQYKKIFPSIYFLFAVWKKLNKIKEKKPRKIKKKKLKIFGCGWKPDWIALDVATKPDLAFVGSDLDLAAQPDLRWDSTTFGTEKKKTTPLIKFFELKNNKNNTSITLQCRLYKV
jgi:hypothetical protein